MPHDGKKPKDMTKEELAEELVELLAQGPFDDPYAWIYDAMLEGHRGYMQYTKEELLAEWHEIHCADVECEDCLCDCHDKKSSE